MRNGRKRLATLILLSVLALNAPAGAQPQQREPPELKSKLRDKLTWLVKILDDIRASIPP